MGMGMSRNILKAGHELIVYDVRPEPLETLVQEGAYAATSPREVGEAADFVFIMVLNVETGQSGTPYRRTDCWQDSNREAQLSVQQPSDVHR